MNAKSTPDIKNLISELLQEPKTFKDLYASIGARQGQHRPDAFVGGKFIVNAANMKWLHEIEQALHDVAFLHGGLLYLKPKTSKVSAELSIESDTSLPLDASPELVPNAAPDTNQRKRRKTNSAPGVMAKKHGTPLKRGAATQVMTYPRPKTKAVLVDVSREVNESLSSFLVKAALFRAAKIRRCKVSALIPKEEFQLYV